MSNVILMSAHACITQHTWSNDTYSGPAFPSTTTRNQLYDGVNLVADYDATDTMVRRYVHGPGVDEPLVVYEGAGTATKNWQYADHLGSIIATADATGASTAIYTYGPFGESSLTTGIRYGYTGQRSMAALGLLYYKARFYSPSLGRFLQPDPIGYADDLNLYAYVGNNPVNFTDPSGLVVNWAKGIKLIPDDAPIYKIGAALGGVGAAAVGAATGDSNLFNTALDGLSATRADNIELLIMLGAGGRVGANSSTSLYQKIGPAGEHLKYGVANNPSTRYTQEELGGGRLKILAEGSRQDMLKLERGLHETLPIGSQEGQKFYIQKQIEKGLAPPPYKP